MCGIAGYYARDGRADLALVRAMGDEIRHRGPDDEGFHVDGSCGIGMRRLSIIDLSTGHQPISNEDETVWVVFNGEIYNYRELRQDLIQRGHQFRTNSDTETLVHLYEEEGIEGIQRLRGMFAYAIWDARTRSVLLVRDRFGKKPLYYSVLAKGLYFGSELKCLRRAGVPLEVDTDALRLYFKFNYIPDPFSAFRDIRKLPAASWMRYHADGRVEQGQYWKLPKPAEQAPPDLTQDQAQSRIRELFDESVRLRMIADVPLGAFLSGGIDSTSVVASMALQSAQPVKTFSIGFEEADFNELPHAQLIADKYKTEHHPIVVRPDSVDLISRLVKHFDEPFGDSSAIPTFLVSEFAVRHVKVALTGDGGDELFAGYDINFDIERFRKLDRVPVPARRVLAWIADRLPSSAYGKRFMQMASQSSPWERYLEHQYTSSAVLKRLGPVHGLPPADSAFVNQAMARYILANGVDILTRAMYFEATANLTGDMLVKVDRMSMANSLEVRSPLLDHELAEFAARIPHSWKMNVNQRPVRGKEIFIQAMGDRLPPELLKLRKKGFGIPLAKWFRGPLRSFVRDYLTSSRFQNRDLISAEFTRDLLNEHDSGRRDNSHWLWRLLMLELWFRDLEAFQATPARDADLVRI